MANPDKIIYIDIEDQHSDTYRFIKDCEKWFGKKIEILKSPLGSVEKCCLSCQFIRSPHDAACTNRLKKRVRKQWEYENVGRHTYVWGFDCNEQHRAEGTTIAMTNYNHLYPILNKTKIEVHGILKKAGIKRPFMYDLGYHNNNCIGCVRGGMGYWNKIRIDFPDIFLKRSIMERKIGAHILKECYLDELEPNRGREQKIIVPDCGIYCEINNFGIPKDYIISKGEDKKLRIEYGRMEFAEVKIMTLDLNVYKDGMTKSEMIEAIMESFKEE
jgi:hypothetical protein